MTNKKKLRSGIIILIMVLVAVIGNGFYDGYLDTKDKSGAIIKVLENNCDCKTIEQSIYISGIQFEKDGIIKEKGEFQLINCNFESLDIEVNRINEILKNKVKNFNELDQLKLEFINNDVSKNIIIKNGIVQNFKN